MVGPGEMARRARGRVTGRIESLPILALSVHSACNCRCVMCDIWKANAEKREISSDDLSRHVEAIRALRVQRVMLTGGEPLLHRNLWALCSELQALRIRITLVTTGLLIEQHAADVASYVDTVVISLDGPRDVHDGIRRVKGGFDRIAKGVMALRAQLPAPRLIARSVVQRDNARSDRRHHQCRASHGVRRDFVSCRGCVVASVQSPGALAAGSHRRGRGPRKRPGRVGVGIDRTCRRTRLFESGFVAGGARLARAHRAVLPRPRRRRRIPGVQCNAPWVSAVLEPGDVLRPCFFQPAYASSAAGPRSGDQLRERDSVSPRPRRHGQRHVPALRVLAQPAADGDGLATGDLPIQRCKLDRPPMRRGVRVPTPAPSPPSRAPATDRRATRESPAAIEGASIVSIASARSAAQSAT